MTTPITVEDLRARLKEGSKVLWLYRGAVESGDVQFLDGDNVYLIWLDGHSTRNDTVLIGELLTIHDRKGPKHAVGGFVGHGYITAAGHAWLQAHPSSSVPAASDTTRPRPRD